MNTHRGREAGCLRGCLDKSLPCIEGHKDGKDGKGLILVVLGQIFFLFRIKRLDKGYDKKADRQPRKYIHTLFS